MNDPDKSADVPLDSDLQKQVDDLVGTPEKPAPGSSITPTVQAQDESIDPKTDELVDDIVAKEGDELIESHDEKIEQAFSNTDDGGWKQKIKDFFARWWANPYAKWGTIVGGVLLVLVIAILPTTRYFVLNTVGIRSRASVEILDESTQQPLKGVQVSLANKSAQTDDNGKASLSGVKLGKTILRIEKRGFASTDKTVTVGWGSNPFGKFTLTPKGTQFVLSAVDFLSDKVITSKLQATSGEADAQSDEKGVIKITIDKPEDEVEVKVSGEGYREETVKFSSTTKDVQKVKMVPARKHAFVSKRSGKFDLYKIDADAKNEEVVLAGTGLERDDMAVVAHPTKDLVAFVSSRDDKRNSDGYLLSTLNIIDLKDNKANKIAQSERVEVIGWSGDRLIYVQVAAGASAANSKRNRLMSFDQNSNSSKELAATNYFNDVSLVQGKVYYAPSSSYQPASNIGLFRSDADGSNKKTILTENTWGILRTGYTKLALSQDQTWYEYVTTDGKLTKLGGAPSNQSNRIYIDSPDSKRSLWVDTRDGKGTLQSYDPATGKDTTAIAKTGLKNPLRWLSNSTVVYRIASGQETADYVFNVDGGEPKKIKDVTNTAGIDKWYYY